MLQRVNGTPLPLRHKPERPPVLIVLHQASSTPGKVGYWLRHQGFPLDIRRPPLGDPLPDTLAHHAGAVVFGGPMSANDETEHVRREIDWLSVPLKEDKPFLGICLGAQMLVRHLGGRVFRHPAGLVEIGYRPITPTPAGRALFRHWPHCVYEWHNEGFDLVTGAELLATVNRFENQAFRYGRAAFGLQFHPEITLAMIHRWTVKAAPKLRLPGAHPRERHIASHLRFGPGQAVWLDAFLRFWTGLMTETVNLGRATSDWSSIPGERTDTSPALAAGGK